MPLLSSPVAELKPFYDVVIIGSGYGGSIAASVLARTRRADGTPIRVCLLERGREIPTGRFPTEPARALGEFQVHALGKQVGHEDALFWLHAGKDISVFQGCGLGGTSLVNANVALPPQTRVWQDKRWPRALLEDLESGLKAGFDRARAMLKPTPYPGTPRLKKVEALRKAAAHLGAEEQCYFPPINVNFTTGTNHVGIHQAACNGCGDCVSGCNYGSKNTLMMNYLPDARNHGAEIYCRLKVLRIERADEGWRVHYQPIGCDRDKFAAGSLFVGADTVIVSAGTLGSNEILLRSKRHGLSCSDRLGQGFTGNGDVLGFGYNNDCEINGIGMGDHKVSATDPPGPCITGIIDRRAAGEYRDAHVIEEGTIPGALAPILVEPMKLIAELSGQDTDAGVWDTIQETTRKWASDLPGGAYRGAMRHTQTYLVMSHDGADGRVELNDDSVELSWPGVGAQPHFAQMNAELVRATEALGGTYFPTPTFNRAFGYDLITVHPLGGCAMADDAQAGVTDHKGRVFRGTTGDSVYDSLYVSDGSVLPCSVGINPLLTISAIAERNTRLLAHDRGWTIDDRPSTGPAYYNGQPDPNAGTSLQFTEKMAGYCSTDVLEEGRFKESFERGQAQTSPCHFVLTIYSDDLAAMIRDPEHHAGIYGTVDAPALSAAPMTVFDARFNLFVDDPNGAQLKRMRYRMAMRSVEGKNYYFDGYKVIRDDKGADIWADTTTLYVSIYRGTSAQGPKVAQGILHISQEDFARQMTTMRATDGQGRPDPLAVARFGQLFARNLWDVYFR